MDAGRHTSHVRIRHAEAMKTSSGSRRMAAVLPSASPRATICSSSAEWSPDGQTLAFVEPRPETGYDIWVLPLTGDRQPRPIIQTRFNEAYPDFSPDGRWLAYASNESGRNEVYVQPYPGPGPRQQVSTDGGTGAGVVARWTRALLHDHTNGWRTGYPHQDDGRDGRVAADVHRRRAAHALSGQATAPPAGIRSYDVTADGRRFLMVQQKERPPVSASDMILVQNWFEELKARVPAK